ncbi:branched-chain amino acid ABC transporter permease [Rugosimonospora africana]|uniref:Branched-chain amino acid ABC transporter permease n=1 Tax=Rugosimonospora africana TaxID=556532 RepID=A0A8J3QXG2_9ACTN|nr:branched-chain amino acid ABC transporter permease [Rugosimonospora africana]
MTVTGLAQGAIYALFALGYTLVYGVLRLINFAHSEVFIMGTFACLITWGFFGLDQNSAQPSVGGAIGYLLLGLAVAAVVSGLTALLVELVAYRPLRRRNAPPLAFLITAIGASTVISETIGVLTHHNPRGVPPMISTKPVVHFGNTDITGLQILMVVLALALMVLLEWFVGRTRLGRGIRAVAQSPDGAALMGVNKNRVISLVFLLGGLMAGVAAVMYVLKIGDTRYDQGFTLGIQAFTAAVLGGIGNLRGALVGGFLLGLVGNYGSGLFGTAWHDAVGFVILVVILMFRPTGLLGEALGKARA